MTIVWGTFRAALDPTFAQACDDCLGPLSDTWIVVQGLRSMAQQAALYAQGRTTGGEIVTYAEPGQSAHNVGLAIDVGLQGPSGPTWNYADPAWKTLWDAVRAAPILHSGEDFPQGETDPDHIERLNWRQHESAPPQSET